MNKLSGAFILLLGLVNTCATAYALPGEKVEAVLAKVRKNEMLHNLKKTKNEYSATGKFWVEYTWRLPVTTSDRVTVEICDVIPTTSEKAFAHRDSSASNALKAIYGFPLLDDYNCATKLREFEKGDRSTRFFKGKKFAYQATGRRLKIMSLSLLAPAMKQAAAGHF